MATPKISVRELRPTDMPSFVELCKSREGLDAESAILRGKVVEHVAFRNPHDDGKPTYLVGVQGDRVVAHLGRMPTRFCVNGSIEEGSYFHDLYVHPDIRKSGGQGFFLSMKLYKAAEDASSGFIAMIWTNEINIALQTARKYDRMWTDRLIAALPKLLARRILSGVDATKRAFTKRAVSIEMIDRFDERFDNLAESVKQTNVTVPWKDSTYLNWKYCDRGDLRPVIQTAVDTSGQLRGFSVITEPDAEYRASFLSEFTVADHDASVMRNLLDATINAARSRGANRLVAVATLAPYRAVLTSRLFVPRNTQEPLFLAKTERSREKDCILSIENWHMSFGDSEGPF